MFINRDIEELLIKAVKQFPAVVLTGARQVGKSTLLKKIFANYNYANLDTLQNKSYANSDPEGFLNDYHCPVIIDEIQEAPQLLSYIKKHIDQNRQSKGQFIITGSQQFALMEGIQESLAGRAAILDLASLSMNEVSKFIKELTWTEIILKGSYPEPFTDETLDKNLWYSSYIRTVINRDISKYLDPENISNYEKFVTLLAARTSQELNYSDIAKELGLNYKTIQSWIFYLQRSQIVFFVQPYFKILEKRIVKKSKLYFYDSGIVAELTGHRTPDQIKNGPMAGAFFENLVISELMKQNFCLSHRKNFYFYRDNNKLEIDLIIDDPISPSLLEIKSTSTPSIQHTANLTKLKKILNLSSSSLYLIHSGNDQSKPNNVNFLNFRNFKLD